MSNTNVDGDMSNTNVDEETLRRRQEMFDRAVRGLASQGFEKCEIGGSCRYADNEGRHCAWGWVDPSLTSSDMESVYGIRHKGVAATMSEDEILGFGLSLQKAHDLVYTFNTTMVKTTMVKTLQRVANKYGLTWPADVVIPAEGV